VAYAVLGPGIAAHALSYKGAAHSAKTRQKVSALMPESDC